MLTNKQLRKTARRMTGGTVGEITGAASIAAMELRREVRENPDGHPYFSDLEVFFTVIPDNAEIRVDCMRTDTVACVPPVGMSKPPMVRRVVRSARMRGRNRYVLKTAPPPSGIAWLLGVLFHDEKQEPMSERELIDFFKSTVRDDIGKTKKAGDKDA